jgi:hypothetical protein
MAIASRAWLDHIDREYLGEFIPAGGGAVRFVVSDSEVLADLAAALRVRAANRGLQVVDLNVASVRLHMLQNVVFAVAASLPWERLLQTRLEGLLKKRSYHWPDPGHAVPFDALAAENGVAPQLLRKDMMQVLSSEIWSDASLTQDFRSAMIALLEHRLTGEGGGLAEAVMTWLLGELKSIGLVRQAGIGRRIGRHNARATLASLCRWIRSCDGCGLAVLLDIRQLHRDRRAVTEGFVYSPAAVMDCYEVLRQVIDEAEEFAGLFLVVLADEVFVSEDPRRSLSQYTALQMRIWDDVRPKDVENPLSPLVRVTL